MANSKDNRSINFIATKYHRRIMAVAFFPVVIIFAVLLIFMNFFYPQMADMILFTDTARTLQFINEQGSVLFLLLGSLAVLILLWAYAVSRDMVGAFGRILRELDAIIDGGERKHIRVRKSDDPATPLTDRINILIDNILKDRKNLRAKN